MSVNFTPFFFFSRYRTKYIQIFWITNTSENTFIKNGQYTIFKITVWIYFNRQRKSFLTKEKKKQTNNHGDEASLEWLKNCCYCWLWHRAVCILQFSCDSLIKWNLTCFVWRTKFKIFRQTMNSAAVTLCSWDFNIIFNTVLSLDLLTSALASKVLKHANICYIV